MRQGARTGASASKAAPTRLPTFAEYSRPYLCFRLAGKSAVYLAFGLRRIPAAHSPGLCRHLLYRRIRAREGICVRVLFGFLNPNKRRFNISLHNCHSSTHFFFWYRTLAA